MCIDELKQEGCSIL